MQIDSYRAVFFDVGGTLLRVHPSVGDVYANEARRFGFGGSPEELNVQFRKAWKDLGGMESLGQQRGLEVELGFWRKVVRRTFDAVGGVDNFEDCFEHIYEAFRNKSAWRLYEDVEESQLLHRLKDRGAILGVVSNWDSRLEEILDNLGIGDLFDFVLASTVVGSAKPDARIFEEALRLSGVSPEEALHIGDEPATDITGARSVGIDAILIDRKKRFSDASIPTINSFLELILSR